MAEKFEGPVEVTPTGSNRVTINLDSGQPEIGLRTMVPGSAGPGEVETVRLEGSGKVTCNELVTYPHDSYVAKPPNIIKPGTRSTFRVDGDRAEMTLGGQGHAGRIELLGRGGQRTCLVSADGTVIAGGDTVAGQVAVHSGRSGSATVRLLGNRGRVEVGDRRTTGTVVVSGDQGRTIELDGANGNIYLGGNGHDGDLSVRDRDGRQTVRIDGDSGDIVLANADVAECFAAHQALDAGSVVVLGPDGTVEETDCAYDTRVAGVVSGAGSYRPGIVLDHHGDGSGRRVAVALVGKVGCLVDADHGPIGVGDLLTTSPTAGHAMLATDRARSAGALVGKALGSLDRGRAVLSILVTLH